MGLILAKLWSFFGNEGKKFTFNEVLCKMSKNIANVGLLKLFSQFSFPNLFLVWEESLSTYVGA